MIAHHNQTSLLRRNADAIGLVALTLILVSALRHFRRLHLIRGLALASIWALLSAITVLVVILVTAVQLTTGPFRLLVRR